MRPAYYNENEPFAAAWLKALIDKGLIARGDVDSRSIRDVRPDDLRNYQQCHFFAGIGGWSLAFRLAGLPDDFAAWTGSCPCQPFSTAGKRKGIKDDRHLWPVWFRLIRECSPPIVFGEQVASAIGHGWYDAVADDMEGEGYAVGAAVLQACSVGAPHKRERLFFVANASKFGQREPNNNNGSVSRKDAWDRASGPSVRYTPTAPLADDDDARRFWLSEHNVRTEARQQAPFGNDTERSRAVGDSHSARSQDGYEEIQIGTNGREERRATELPGGPWRNAKPIQCADGKTRVIEPGIPLLAHGIPNRVGKLRGYGNAIVPKKAAEFIASVMECAP